VFDAYAQFEESMISAKMETTSEMGPSEEGILVLQPSFEINQNSYVSLLNLLCTRNASLVTCAIPCFCSYAVSPFSVKLPLQAATPFSRSHTTRNLVAQSLLAFPCCVTIRSK